MRHRGFSLIELLVVVAIIALLIAILMPSLSRARESARMAVCMSNQRQIGMAWLAYATTNRNLLVGSHTNANLSWTWVSPKSTPIPETQVNFEDGQLWRYLNSADVYQCPVDPRGYRRSYSMSMYLGGITGWHVTPVLSLSGIDHPSSRLLLLDEADPRGANLGAWAIYPRGHAYEQQWIDWPAGWHFGDSNVHSFADNHTEHYRFQNPDTARITAFYTWAPDNVDLDYFQRIYSP